METGQKEHVFPRDQVVGLEPTNLNVVGSIGEFVPFGGVETESFWIFLMGLDESEEIKHFKRLPISVRNIFRFTYVLYSPGHFLAFLRRNDLVLDALSVLSVLVVHDSACDFSLGGIAAEANTAGGFAEEAHVVGQRLSRQEGFGNGRD